MSLIKRPVSFQEVSTAIVQARTGEKTMDPAVAWFLRALSVQFFRPTATLAEMADTELTTLYASDFNEDPVIDISSTISPSEDGYSVRMRDLTVGPIRQDTSPLNYRVQTPHVHHVACKSDEVAAPTSVACAD